MTEEVKFIDIKEFRLKGFLQEANRLFFHPLGLALAVHIHQDGTETLDGIWDYRDDPEGMFYGQEMIEEDRIEHVLDLKNSKRFDRLMAARGYGYTIDSDSIQGVS